MLLRLFNFIFAFFILQSSFLKPSVSVELWSKFDLLYCLLNYQTVKFSLKSSLFSYQPFLQISPKYFTLLSFAFKFFTSLHPQMHLIISFCSLEIWTCFVSSCWLIITTFWYDLLNSKLVYFILSNCYLQTSSYH